MMLVNEDDTRRMLVEFISEIDQDDLFNPDVKPEPYLDLHSDNIEVDASRAAAFLDGRAPVQIRLGKVQSRRYPGFDQLTIPVSGPELDHLIKLLCEYVYLGESPEDFRPCIVLAQVAKGKGPDYSGDPRFNGRTLTASVASIHDNLGQVEQVPMRGKKPAPARKKPPVPRQGARKPSPAPTTTTAPVVDLRAVWSGLTGEAKKDLNQLRRKGTDSAIRKACRIVRVAVAGQHERGLLLDWVLDGWTNEPAPTRKHYRPRREFLMFPPLGRPLE